MKKEERTNEKPIVLYGVSVGRSSGLLRGQMEWLRNRGWSVSLATTPDPKASEICRSEGADLYPLPMTRRITPFKDLVALLRWLTLILHLRPDAVNVSTPKAGLLGGVAAWTLRVPKRIYVVRGLRLEGAAGITGKVLGLMERLSTSVATDVVFVSMSLAQEAFRRRLVDPRKSWLIGTGSSKGVDADGVRRRVESASRPEVAHRLGLDPASFVVGFIGRIAVDKGLDTLIDAFQSGDLDPRSRLVVVGDAEDQALYRRLGALNERICLVPYTTDPWEYLAVFDVLCLPTHREGFPNVVLEASAAGLPSITTRATGALDSVVHEETGFLIDVNDASALARRINQLERDSELTRTMGNSARRRAVEEFPQERIWQGVSEILEGRQSPIQAKRIRHDLIHGENL